MSRKALVSLLVVGALAIAAVVGAAVYQTTQAATPAAPRLAGDIGGFAHKGGLRGPGGGQADKYLADALGISVDELNAAYQEAAAAALKQAVEKGLITQAQADELSARGLVFPFGRRWGGWLAKQGIDFEALLADALDISTDELQAARQKAADARLEQAVADGRITQEQADLMKARKALFSSQEFIDAMQAAFQAAVQKAVDSGLITQAQADLILQHQAERSGFFPGGRHGGRGGWEGAPPFNPAPDAPTIAPSAGTGG
jgi:hypothetical protein